jgi:hypothetical protein
VGDASGTTWAYNIGAPTKPGSPLAVTFPNDVLAAGGGVVASVGQGALNVLFRQSFSSPGKLFGFRIPLGNSGIIEFSTAICVDASANIYATTLDGYVVFKSAFGTFAPFATVKVSPGNGSIGAVAAAPDGTIALQIISLSSPTNYVERFSSVQSGSKLIATLNVKAAPTSTPLAFTFDGAGRLFLSYGSSIVVYAPNAQKSAAPVATFGYPFSPAAIAVDGNDVAYVLANGSSNQTIDAYRFNGSAFARRWSIAAPLHARWVAVLQ